jgi:nucleoid-associated protein YgaU
MSKETKVGLVVGLGFIVMFAVILSKKAGTVPYAELERDLAFGGEGTIQLVDSAISSPATVQEPPPTAPEPEEPIVQSLPFRNDIAPEPADTVSLTAPAPTFELARRPAYPGLAPRDLSSESIELPKVMANQDTSVEEDSPSASPEPATGVNLPARIPDRARTTPTPPAPATPFANRPEEKIPAPSDLQPKEQSQPTETHELTQPKPTPPEPSPLNDRKIKTKQYIAQAKDTLFNIALMHYGTRHPDGVQRIFEANKDQLKSIDKLKIGQRLIIPEWEGAISDKLGDGLAAGAVNAEAVEKLAVAVTLAAEKSKSAPPTPALMKMTPEKDDQKPELKFRMYEVQANDSFSTIAEREMGTMHLWKELHRANKDKIPTPEKLRVGIKIRIPLELIAHNGEADDEEE